jgi:6-oxo-cyclohex-1-ene-carbonyl-CoA hydrolase
MLDDFGRPSLGAFKTGEEKAQGKAVLRRAEIDLSLLDREVDALATKLLMTMPDCLSKTIESVRKHKLSTWDRNRETNRAWLALNMSTEARAGFRAFNEGPKGHREVDFVELRRRIAAGHPWDAEMEQSIQPVANEKA